MRIRFEFGTCRLLELTLLLLGATRHPVQKFQLCSEIRSWLDEFLENQFERVIRIHISDDIYLAFL